MQNFVFDLYGTLVDINTDEGNKKFKARVEKYFKKFGADNFWPKYLKLCEQSDPDSEVDLIFVFSQILGGSDRQTVLKAARVFRKYSTKRLKAYNGVRDLLKSLKEGGGKLYLLSNAQSCFTLYELEKLKLKDCFDGIELSSDFGYKKPSQKFFKHLIDKYSLDPSQTVYTGNDLTADILGAKAAGFKTAYIKSNISPQEDSLESAKATADFATESFKDLSAYLISLT